MAQLRASKAGVNVPSTASGRGGVTQTAWGYYEHGASPAAADTVLFCKLPKGALVIGGRVKGDKLDSAGSGSSLASINIGLDAAVTTPDGTSVSDSSTSLCLLAALNLGPVRLRRRATSRNPASATSPSGVCCLRTGRCLPLRNATPM